MVHNFRESKEEIKDRMIRSALDFWNIKKVENLDPFVRLLMEALAMQLHLVSDDVTDIEVRTMKRLSEVLLPESYSVASPAYSLMQVTPKEGGASVHPLLAFSATDPFSAKSDNAVFSFYPVVSSELRRAFVRSLIVGDDLYEVLPDLSKKLVARGSPSAGRVGKVFIGIDFEGDSFDFQSLALYLDFPNIDQRRHYLALLSYCKWSCCGRSLAVASGLQHDNSPQRAEQLCFCDVSEDVDAYVREIYKHNFVTFSDDFRSDADSMAPLPEGFENVGLQKEPGRPLLWLEVSFPPSFTVSILRDLQVLLNVVPVVNKELHRGVATVRKNFGVVPLPLSERESFLCVKQVVDDAGRLYKRSGWTHEGTDSGYYALRKGGCESFDRRDARDYLLRLQHLLEDEMAMFSSSELGQNSESRYLVETLVDKISRTNRRMGLDEEPLHYLFVDPPGDNALFYADYWTTFGASANGIRAGSVLNPPTEFFGELEQAQLVVSSIGGVGLPTEQERIERFKYLLTSRDRIVTNADIEDFCRAELADCLSDVYLEKGVSPGVRPGDGLLRTIDVHLVLGDKSEGMDRMSLKDRIYDGLVARSPMTFNYRVIID